jgi:PBSX family phage terminase large subunit
MSRIKKKRLVQTKSSVTVKTNNEIILLPKQKEFIFLEDRFTALSGGFGSAKTFAGCMKGVILSGLFPGNSGLVSRMTYPELRDSTRKTFLELVPPSWILSWNESFNTLILKNGSQVIFRPIDDIRKQRSLNLGWFYIDQAEECTQEDFHDLAGRLRHPVPKQYGFCTVNPDGHNWVWQDFFNKPRKQYKGLNSTTFDNPYLPPGYIQSLIDAYPKEWVERFVYGSHEVRSGVILSEYTDDLQVDPFIIPSTWIKGRGMDWGIRAPCTRVSVALSPDGIFYIFDCYAKAELDPEEHAVNILERDRGIAYQMTKMDSAAWSRDGTTKDPSKLSPATRFIKAGVKMSPATRDFMGSLVNLKSLMKQGKIRFFRGQCDELIEEIKQWKWGKLVAGKEKPAVGSDHLLDACFVGKTPILTDKGNRPISEIKKGDFVMTRKGYKRVIDCGITNKNAEVRKYTFLNGSTLTATKNHPILTTKGFKPIGTLTHKDIVCIRPINTTKQNFVQGLVRLNTVGRKEKSKVYNLTVEDCPEYVANGIIVHNCRYIIFALTGRQSESVGPERKVESESPARRIFIQQGGRASMTYDKVTGCPLG